MNVGFLSIAEEELLDAFHWYEEQKHGLGLEFIDEVDRAVRRILHYPESCTDQGGGVRRVLLARFPYCLWYGFEGEMLIVYAIAHLHREPRYWSDRFTDEKP